MVHRAGGQLGECRAQHRADHHIAWVVHAGVHPGLRHDTRGGVQRKRGHGQLVPNTCREGERRGRVT
jgi:hypothetical protein